MGTEHRHISTQQTAATARRNAEEKTIEKNTAIPGCKSEKEEVEPKEGNKKTEAPFGHRPNTLFP